MSGGPCTFQVMLRCRRRLRLWFKSKGIHQSANLPESDWRSRSPFFNEPQLSVNLQAIDLLKEIAASKNITISQLALAWVLRRPELTAAIVGSPKPEQIQETVQADDIKLSEDEIARIEEILKDRELAIANLDMSALSGARF